MEQFNITDAVLRRPRMEANLMPQHLINIFLAIGKIIDAFIRLYERIQKFEEYT